MYCGTLVMEDTVLSFHYHANTGTVTFTVSDTVTGRSETITNASASAFFKALAIAVHMDGCPDGEADYAEAETVQGIIRWIP